jgi:PAS domain S-box-containing protein
MESGSIGAGLVSSLAVFEGLPQAVIVTDLQGEVLYCNPAVATVYGYAPDEIVGTNVIGLLVIPDDGPSAREIMTEISAGRSWTGDFTVRRRDGVTVRARVSDSPLRDSEGRLVGVVGISEDVTDQRLQAAVVEYRERRLELALQAGGFGTWDWDLATGVTVIDERLEALFGLRKGEFDGTFDMWKRLLHPAERDAIVARVHQAVAEGGTYEVQHRIIWPDGSVHWLEGLGQVTRDDAGNVTGTTGCTRDVTGRIATEHQLRESIAEQRRLTERLAAVAAELQMGLAPHDVPTVPGVELAALYRAGGDELERIGGDWYDAIQLPGGRLVLVVGDVMGRGVRAATTMTRLRAAVRAYIADDPAPSNVLARMDRLMRQEDVDEFVTLFYAVLDPATGELRYLNAGHLPPLMVCADGVIRSIENEPAVPLGLAADRGAENVAQVGAGDMMLIYTDGLVERPGADLGEGVRQLVEIAQPQVGERLADLVVRIVESMRVGGIEDDVTILAAKRAEPRR